MLSKFQDDLRSIIISSLKILNFKFLYFKIIHKIESHDNMGGPAHSSHEEEEEAPTATSVKTVSCVKLNKHKSKVKQNAIVSH